MKISAPDTDHLKRPAAGGRRTSQSGEALTLTGVVEVLALEDERLLRDGARVELQAEDGLAAIYRLPMAMVALDKDVAAQSEAALAEGHGEVAGAVVHVVNGRRVHRNAALIHLGDNWWDKNNNNTVH